MARAAKTWGDRARREQAGRDSLLPRWDGLTGLYVVQHKGESKFYLLSLIGSTPDSVLLSVLPLGEEESYQVRVGSDSRQCSCECKGYMTGGYCRHLIGLCAFYRSGELYAKSASNVGCCHGEGGQEGSG